ncbi:PDGLE domain-containing protein [Gordonia rhizosphera]|uniref:PDGLE domain-containing protein n=1 Tax=Gordonia rhizosphera NBRC 16068 TaxID=1108045 RepID=K6VNI8_9ACTN|nr:PDGLE domain-containing protein [Gordonia rhizosphera]GAB88470.1 hypothetical protein GORHZ_025_00100 [Gordonia rhizosphera NBRC 16068]
MTTTNTRPRLRRRTFLALFALAALLIAGIVSYAASSSPDGLDSATLRGCQTATVDGVEELTGNCIAQHATDHAMASSPLAGYSVRGIGLTNGIAGVIGVLVTLAVAGGLFWLIASRRSRSAGSGTDGGR